MSISAGAWEIREPLEASNKIFDIFLSLDYIPMKERICLLTHAVLLFPLLGLLHGEVYWIFLDSESSLMS